MPFSFVPSTNEGAVRLWNMLSFDTVELIPDTLNKPFKGHVVALVMYMV